MLKVRNWVGPMLAVWLACAGSRAAHAGTTDTKAIAREMHAAEAKFARLKTTARNVKVNAVSAPPPYFGTNPTNAEIKAKLIAAGAKYRIPPHILFGIAYQETGWAQYRTDGRTIYHQEPDGRNGVGIMQMTVLPSDANYARLCTDIDYNIDRGAALLIDKWNATPIIGDGSGQVGREKLENWFYAIWAYNGFVCPNPNNYAPNVLAHIANGRSRWTPVAVTDPNITTCPPTRIQNTPTPIHIDADFNGVIDPAVDTVPPSVTLTSTQSTGVPYTTPQTISWTIADADGSGIAGWGRAWDADPGSSTYTATSGSLTVPLGSHILHVHTRDKAGNDQDFTFGPYIYRPADSTENIVFQDNFDAGQSGSNWTVNKSGSDAFADFAFDYSTLGIPSAPRSSGGTTKGARFLVNQSAGVFQGISASPTGQAFTGDFTIRFNAWLNYVGPLTAGGSGSTQMASFGWGTNGTAAQWPGGSNGILFAASTDLGTASPYRLYRNNALLKSYSGLTQFGSKTAPLAQLALYPQQSGTTPAGTFSMSWHEVQIQKSGTTLTWSIDDSVIATADVQTPDAKLAGSNLFLGMFDINATSSTDANDFLNAAIYDNLTVTVPTPPTIDVTSKVSVFRSGASRNRATGRYKETVVLKNTTGSSISGPFYLVMDNLSANATPYQPSGTTSKAPVGSPYLTISSTDLPAGANLYVVLEFTISDNMAYTFTPRVLAGGNTP